MELSILATQRNHHEMIERLSDEMVKEVYHTKTTKREQVNSEHRLKKLMERAVSHRRELIALYEDKDGLRKAEIASLTSIDEFYRRYKMLAQTKEIESSKISIPMSAEFDEMARRRENPDEDMDLVPFTDEEGYGKFVDLHEHHQKFINLKGVERLDYLSYLSSFDQFSEIEKSNKNVTYKEYLVNLLSYFKNYMARAKPLFDLEEQRQKVLVAFENDWSEGNCPGWPKETSGALSRAGAPLELSTFSCWEELASLGLDRLKSALMALELKCGGTLEERAKRLFACKGKELNDIPSSFRVNSKRVRVRSEPGKVVHKDSDAMKELALLEAEIFDLAGILSEERTATKENVQRKQAMSVSERDDSDEENIQDDESDDESSDVIYNPKNVPLGWDGKPIPYWLYKLHGLNITYSCEICKGHVYRGPKEFQQHFSEPRHANGMKLLNIPNTAHFANVTKIHEAISLWEKLRATRDVDLWKPEAEEECEDSSGNVINLKTFHDLSRQGLL